MKTVYDLSRAVLSVADPVRKCAAAANLKDAWDAGALDISGFGDVPDRPARPDLPRLVPPGDVPRRRLGTEAGRGALLHAVAHIEFNAIDLAADMIARFGGSARINDDVRAGFISDWVGVCSDEARHFRMVTKRLMGMGVRYGDHTAHDGLWDAALATKDDLMARLVIAPMVLEARGLDVTPGMIEKLQSAGDRDSCAVLQVIYDEEVAHVAAGSRWFRHICEREGRNPDSAFETMVTDYFNGRLKPPFNVDARTRAEVPYDWYAGLT